MNVNNVPSEPKQVTSGVPQGSVIGPSLFVSFINDYPECLADLIAGVRTLPLNVRDLPMSTQTYMALFADDTKVYRVIKSIADRLLLQHDLRCMDEWSHQSLLKLQPPKCKAMTVSNRGEAENAHTYTLEGHAMERTKEEKDIGVTVDNKLTFDTHIANQVNKANKVMGIIRRSYTHLDAYNFKLLFKALVRPHLEYAHAVWNPHLRRHIDALENVQRRATRQIPGFAHLSYPQRLQRLNLPTLAFRRLRGDVIEAFKILSGHYDEAASSGLLTLSRVTHTRGHPRKLAMGRTARTNKRLNFFTQRVVRPWNSLPGYIACAPTMYCFENRLDRHWAYHPLRWDPNHRPETRAAHRGRHHST